MMDKTRNLMKKYERIVKNNTDQLNNDTLPMFSVDQYCIFLGKNKKGGEPVSFHDQTVYERDKIVLPNEDLPHKVVNFFKFIGLGHLEKEFLSDYSKILTLYSR